MLKFVLTLITLLYCYQNVASEAFSFHLLSEPQSLDPSQTRGPSGSYFFSNVYRSLYRYDSKLGLIPEGAIRCKRPQTQKIVCELDPQKKWSQGDEITADQYVETFQRIFNHQHKSVQTELLTSLKNAKLILAGQTRSLELGVYAKSKNLLEFVLEEEDPDFEYKLAYPTFSPTPPRGFTQKENSKNQIVNGPYVIKKWEPGKKISLLPNPFYDTKSSSRPPVEIFIVESDATALNLFLAKKMSFLRRLNSHLIDKYKDQPGFFQVPVARFDYIGFGPSLKPLPNLRRALSLSLNYSELQSLLKALGPPGCPSLPKRFFDKVPCHNFDPIKARELLKSSKENLEKESLYFSQMGGEDIAKSMEWVQHQWKKNLKLEFELRPVEDAMYLSMLKSHPPGIFRKGISLDRPTCLAAVEIFKSDHPENLIQLKSSQVDKWIQQLHQSPSESNKKKICSLISEYLIKEAYIIPLGEIHFSMLEDQKFSGWHVNEINQLDLTHLKSTR